MNNMNIAALMTRIIRASVAHAAIVDSPGPNQPSSKDLREAQTIGREIADACLALGRAIIADNKSRVASQ